MRAYTQALCAARQMARDVKLTDTAGTTGSGQQQQAALRTSTQPVSAPRTCQQPKSLAVLDGTSCSCCDGAAPFAHFARFWVANCCCCGGMHEAAGAGRLWDGGSRVPTQDADGVGACSRNKYAHGGKSASGTTMC